MTEADAKLKWCPFARVAMDDVGGAFNRWTAGETVKGASPALCIGSDCMAWRGREKHPNDVVHVQQDPGDAAGALMDVLRSDADRNGWPIIADPVEPGGGYCGLAGAPQ